MSLAIRMLEASSTAAWDRFVQTMPDGTFFHLAAWRTVIEQAFGHRTCYLFAERDGAVTGVLPLAHLRTRLFGNTLVSVPFCVYGGPLAADAETLAALTQAAEAEMRRCRSTATEFRLRDATATGWTGEDWTERNWLARPDLYVTFRKSIEADDERNMKAIPRKQRAMVRKGIQNGLVSVVGHEIGALHRVYAESVRNLGTPVFGRRYFSLLLDIFRDCSDVVTILKGETPVAAVMNFYFRDEVLPYYGGGTAAARQLAGNDFMYWEVMRRAAASGARMFDFGRSKLGTGAFAFKHNWGFTPTPLHYRFRLMPGASIPDINPMNPKYRLFIAAWKRLPLPIAGLLGPPIVRGLG